MVKVIGVRFQNAGKLYFFDPGSYWPTAGDFVIVETTRGVEFGEVVTGVKEIADDQLTAPLKQVIRIANVQDVQHARDNERAEKEAYGICQQKIADHKLDMKLVSVEYTFDNSKILFYFTANGRVDFRALVKDLASVFKTRIELRQIGVRDEAKMLGGLGPCGRPICCGTFLGDFQPVSIKMAKEQNLSLNPTKISGVCGRLMCCLKYEQENYEQIRKQMPKVGKEVVTPEGTGVVWELNVIKETVRVRLQKGDSSELKDFPMGEVQRVNAPQAVRPAREEDAPEMPEAQEAAAAEPAETRRGQARPSRGNRPERGARKEEQAADKPKESRTPGLGKPVMRENPKRRKEAAAREAAAAQEMPAQAEQPEALREEKAAAQERKPAASPWQQAVAQALRAAQEDERIEEKNIRVEDHEDTFLFVEETEEDDTI